MRLCTSTRTTGLSAAIDLWQPLLSICDSQFNAVLKAYISCLSARDLINHHPSYTSNTVHTDPEWQISPYEWENNGRAWCFGFALLVGASYTTNTRLHQFGFVLLTIPLLPFAMQSLMSRRYTASWGGVGVSVAPRSPFRILFLARGE
jgi:hypothetical protein